MTTIHDVTNEKSLIKPLEKRPGALKEMAIHDDQGNLALPFLKVLDNYNKRMSGCDIYSYLINIYITARTHLKV